MTRAATPQTPALDVLKAELRRFDEQYLFMFNHLQVGVVMHDVDTRLMMANDTAVRMLGHPRDRLVGARNADDIWDFCREDGAKMPVEDYPAEQALRTRQIVRDVVVGVRRPVERDVVWAMVTAFPVLDDAGGVRRVVTSFTDITELTNAKALLTLSLQQVQAAAQAKADFLANMSHEIRTPLTAILGFAHLAQVNAASPDRVVEYAGHISNSGETLLRLLNDILEFSELEGNSVALKTEPMALRPLLEEAVSLFSNECHKKGVDLRLELAPDLPDCVRADPQRLRQVINNLLGNAVKFTDEGEIVVKAAKGRRRDAIQVSVCDTGMGVPKAMLPHLFERFAHADASTSGRRAGAGLGLAISKALVELMNGRLKAHSVEGLGSEFTFDFRAPACPPDA